MLIDVGGCWRMSVGCAARRTNIGRSGGNDRSGLPGWLMLGCATLSPAYARAVQFGRWSDGMLVDVGGCWRLSVGCVARRTNIGCSAAVTVGRKRDLPALGVAPLSPAYARAVQDVV
jgi:hypothetical protein